MTKLMPSLSWKGIKKNYSLIPLLMILGLGGGWASFYLYRLATKCPDVTWRRKTNPEPWNEYEHKRYKFIELSGFDHKNYEHPRPRF